jgi:hypothetical protein
MDWLRITCGGILEIGVASFFVFYLVQRSNSEVDDGRRENRKMGQQQFALTQTQQKGGCAKILNLPLAPGIFVTVILAYVFIIMFLFTPLHPTLYCDQFETETFKKVVCHARM